MRVDIFTTDKKYGLIYADPPWPQAKGGKKAVRPRSSGTALDYPVMQIDEIKEHLAKAAELTEENSILFLWTIDKYLIEAQQMAEELGYKLHCRMVWDKVTGIPAAFTVRFSHEYLLFMYRGTMVPVCKEERGKIRTVFVEKPKRHSQKPDVAYEIINRLYPDLKKLEMYARREVDGYDCWGDEVPENE